MDENLVIVGWLEKVHFKEYSADSEEVIAKIDTGADTGALHVVFEEIVNVEGKDILRFQPFTEDHGIIETDAFKKIMVRSSNGEQQERHRVQTVIELRGKEYDIELTLADRSEMNYEVIIGKKFLENRFLVDVSQENI